MGILNSWSNVDEIKCTHAPNFVFHSMSSRWMYGSLVSLYKGVSSKTPPPQKTLKNLQIKQKKSPIHRGNHRMLIKWLLLKTFCPSIAQRIDVIKFKKPFSVWISEAALYWNCSAEGFKLYFNILWECSVIILLNFSSVFITLIRMLHDCAGISVMALDWISSHRQQFHCVLQRLCVWVLSTVLWGSAGFSSLASFIIIL